MIIDTRTAPRTKYYDALRAIAEGRSMTGAELILLPGPGQTGKLLDVEDADVNYSADQLWPHVAALAAGMAGCLDGSIGVWQELVDELSTWREDGALLESPACRVALFELGAAADFTAGLLAAGQLPEFKRMGAEYAKTTAGLDS